MRFNACLVVNETMGHAHLRIAVNHEHTVGEDELIPPMQTLLKRATQPRLQHALHLPPSCCAAHSGYIGVTLPKMTVLRRFAVWFCITETVTAVLDSATLVPNPHLGQNLSAVDADQQSIAN